MNETTDILGVMMTKVDDNAVLDCESSDFYLPFCKPVEYFEDYKLYIQFIKKIEALVRKHPYYNVHINVVMEILGANTCQVLSNITRDDAPLELHHGPILTLFDICMIVLNSCIKRNDPHITTFAIAKKVIEEHRLQNVRVVPLSETAHKLVTDGILTLNYKQGVGNTQRFIDKYRDGIDKEMMAQINQCIEWSLENDSNDDDALQVSKLLTSWGENDFLVE